VLVARRGEAPPVRPVRAAREAAIVPAGGAGATRDLPDLRGMSAREALRGLTKLGLTARVNGTGLVTAQRPAPGTPIELGGTAELWLARSPVALASFADER
jgi:beta-lactam-binding protein with PASTA domain